MVISDIENGKNLLGNPRWGSARRSLQADSSWLSLTFHVMRWY